MNHATAARHRKATRIHETFRGLARLNDLPASGPVVARVLAAAPLGQWRDLARAAGVRMPSAETRALVVAAVLGVA